MRAPALLQRLARDRRGVAAVEMALVSSFVLLPMLGGFVGLSQALAMQNALDRGLHAGLIAAWGQPTLTDMAKLVSAVQDGYGTTPAPTVTATPSWYCISPTGTRATGTTATSGTTCTGGQVLAKYITIAASVSFTPLINIGLTGWNQAGGTGGLVTLSNTATVRVS